MKLTYRQYLADPDLRANFERAVRRERSREIGRALARLWARLKWPLPPARRPHVQGRAA